MINLFKHIFNPSSNQYKEESLTYSELKQQGIEAILGQMFYIVGHAIIPFKIGGSMNMYYFPSAQIKGTGFVTMELLTSDGETHMKNKKGTYELLAFTKQIYNTRKETEFHQIERTICSIFTSIGFYSRNNVLNPLDTCEIPIGENESICLIFDFYAHFKIGNKKHHLLLCTQVFEEELEYAKRKGTKKLIKKLKGAGYYPYSDLNRRAVV